MRVCVCVYNLVRENFWEESLFCRFTTTVVSRVRAPAPYINSIRL